MMPIDDKEPVPRLTDPERFDVVIIPKHELAFIKRRLEYWREQTKKSWHESVDNANRSWRYQRKFEWARVFITFETLFIAGLVMQAVIRALGKGS